MQQSHVRAALHAEAVLQDVAHASVDALGLSARPELSPNVGSFATAGEPLAIGRVFTVRSTAK
jgi:hypothetical protein